MKRALSKSLDRSSVGTSLAGLVDNAATVPWLKLLESSTQDQASSTCLPQQPAPFLEALGFLKHSSMPEPELFYLQAIPHSPLLTYEGYSEGRQSSRSNTRKPEQLNRWQNFEAICTSFQPDTRQLDLVLPPWDETTHSLMPEGLVWAATREQFYVPLNNLDHALGGTDRLRWVGCQSETSGCNAYLELVDCGVIASGRKA